MNFKKKSEAFKKRFGILDSYDLTEELGKFKRRVLNVFDGIDYHLNQREIVKFCTYFGKRAKESQGRISWGNNIHGALESETDEKQLFLMIEAIFMLEIVTKYVGHEVTYSKEMLFNDIKEAIEISEINLSIIALGGEVILHPRGEEVLDKKLVEEVFNFLNHDSQQHIVSALKFFNQRNTKSFIKSAESIRRCIEEFLRFKLKNQKGLTENITELRKRFKNDQISVEIRNIVSQIFSYLDKYFNENCKHNDGDINEAENEFLLYQSGLLVRYINGIIM